MTASWKALEGVTLDERFQLQTLLVEKHASARFLARMVSGPRPAGWLRLVLSEGPPEVRELEHWQMAAGLSHPNLTQVWESGRIERGVTSMVYVLTEPADDDLAAVLRERPLNQVEAREVLITTAKALSYLHARGLVHGSLEPAAILAVGEQTKLSSDTIAPSAESGDGALSVADDLRALGDCVHAMFTQDPHTDLEHLAIIPQPFREIIRGCYDVSPNERWTAQRIVATLDLPAPAATPLADRPALEPEPEPLPPPPQTRRRFPAWVLAAVAAAAVLVFMLRTPHPQAAGRSPAPPAEVGSRVTVPGPAPAVPSPVGPTARPVSQNASDLASSRIWRVVSYTYSRAEDTARMVGEINRKWPHLRAEQFSPKGSGPPYFVALGGRMTRSEALRLQRQAISSGLPPDTFVRNFRK